MGQSVGALYLDGLVYPASLLSVQDLESLLSVQGQAKEIVETVERCEERIGVFFRPVTHKYRPEPS